MSVDSSALDEIKSQTDVGSKVWRLAGLIADDSAIARRSASGALRRILHDIGTVLTIEDYIAKPFKRRIGSKPFGQSRFSDGTWPVFYAAEDLKTTLSEVKFHQKLNLKPDFPARFLAFTCEFSGECADITGWEARYPELIGKSNKSYPFCQQLARQLRERVQGLRTRSARRPSGVCRPIFSISNLSNPEKICHVELLRGGNRILSRTIKL